MLYNLFENRDFVSVFAVALLAEGVDRNGYGNCSGYDQSLVALLAEGVDRNLQATVASLRTGVALLAEGVDRNLAGGQSDGAPLRRPPRGGRG